MRIGIDATPLLLRSAGIKTHLYHWIEALQRFAPEHTIEPYPSLRDIGALEHERSVVSVPGTYARIAAVHFVNRIWAGAVDYLAGDVDVFHVSNQTRAFPRRARITGTIYDMTTSIMPELHTDANVRAEREFLDRVVARAPGLIANSESAKADAVRILGIDPGRLTVIYPGVADAYFRVGTADVERVRRTYGMTKPVMLFVGTIEPRKNVDTLLDAWPQVDADAELWLAGPIGWASGATVQRIRAGLPGMRHIGYVPERDLPALTAAASAFVYPSLYEGFGLPVAQAMASGTPVITSAVSSLPEVVGDAGLLVDPKSASEVARAMQRVLGDQAFRRELSAKGKLQAARWTWKNSAERSAEFFANL